MYKAVILADSISPQGNRLTTMKITFPRFILAEMNTHRMFSRNSASSRAIPFKKMVEMVQENPFIPIAWQKDHKGMQGTEYLTDKEDFGNAVIWCKQDWLKARDIAVEQAQNLNKTGVTKQLCNRLLEPFMWHTVIVTATEWENFFELRCPQYEFVYNDETPSKIFRSKKDCSNWYKDEFSTEDNPYNTDLDWLQINKSQAEIHIQAIAELMYDAYNESTPKKLEAGEWHIPNFGHEWNINKLKSLLLSGNYNDENDITPDINELKIKISTAHNARISYETLGDNPKIDYEADIRLHDMLAKSGHWSPFEHVARAMSEEEESYFYVSDGPNPEDFHSGWCRNFKGFIQYRRLIENG